jgi:acetylornithine/succinyldiaminopimelate/putrescine aminotransferase
MNSTECRNRAENVLMHTYGRYPVVLDHGEDVYLYDTDGNPIEATEISLCGKPQKIY